YFKEHAVDIIINCAAYTAVDKAESEQQLADQVNHLAVRQLANTALAQQAKLIHISTDYVFSGKHFKPYEETDAVDPQSIYGLSKLKGEQALSQIMPINAMIIRTSWVFSEFGHNFVKTMLRLSEQREELNVIYDQVGTPTYAGDLAQAILRIIKNNTFSQTNLKTDIYHYTNEGVCSWYDFACSVFEISHKKCLVKPIETKEYPTPAKRPNYSLLNKSKIKQTYGINIPYWKDSLKQCLNKIQDSKA
ncbi:MAG: dTDP-4-dehydrorhamnose reductase, partial [Cycloclasticus sp.]